MASHITTLSIFIILLAFFIALNSLASFNTQKATPVLESLRKTFGSTEQTADLKPSIRQDEAKASGQGDLIRELEKLFRARLQGIKAAKVEGRDTLLLRVKTEEYQKALDGVLDRQAQDGNAQAQGAQEADDQDPAVQDFMPTLVSMVRSGQSGPQLHMQIMLNISQEGNVSPDMQEAMVSISRIVNQTEQAGIPTRLLAGGVQEGPEEYLDLLFRPYQPFILNEEK